MPRNPYDDRDEPSLDAGLRDMREGGKGLLRGVLTLLRLLWNQEMRLLRWTGLMASFRRYPWLFAVVGLVLLVFLFPLGLLYVASALAAAGAGPSADDDFRV